MRLTLIQKENVSKILVALYHIFKHPKYGMAWENFDDFCCYGKTVTEMLLNKNNSIDEINIYLQVNEKNKNNLDKWLIKLNKNEINTELIKDNNFIKEDYVATILFYVYEIGINFRIIIGNKKPNVFIKRNEPINIFKVLLKNEIVKNLDIIKNINTFEQLNKYTWKTKEFKKDIENRRISISLIKWMEDISELENLMEKIKIYNQILFNKKEN